MGGSEPPYIYDPMPGNRRSVAYPYSDFNPRAATQAHYVALAERAERHRHKAQQTGKPLINFNQHPDSYMIVSEQNMHFDPLPPNTKDMVVNMRWAQFGLRCVEEVIIIGLLVCVICLKMDLNTVGWISRIAPAWDVLITMYGIYHLVRPAKSRPPASSASYHFFALFMDTALIPFYIFIALCANSNWDEVAGVDGRWTSFFSGNQTTTEIILLTFVGSAILAGLHFVSVGFDIYLVMMFRKIAHLPPDMNPFEDNLTTRRPRSVKHKHKNSEATLVSDSAEPFSEKKQKYLSGSTLSDDRLSRVSTAKGSEVRTMPFGHSRMNSDNSFSPHNPETARWSQQKFEDACSYDDMQPVHDPHSNMHQNFNSRSGSMSPSKQATHFENHEVNSWPNSYTPPQSRSPERKANIVSILSDQAQSRPLVASHNEHLLNDNWYVVDNDDPSDDLSNAHPLPLAISAYTRVAKDSPSHDRHDSFHPQPLRMNPPTPPLADDDPIDFPPAPLERNSSPHRPRSDYNPIETGIARAFTVASHGNPRPSPDPELACPSPPSGSGRPKNAVPKVKYYGDLAEATRGVRGAAAQYPRGKYGNNNNNINNPTPETSRTPSPEKKPAPGTGRVVSRTGADIGDASGGYAAGQGPWAGMRGRREASGKVVEEGRGGW